ncbi:Nn.00g031960.m01.CDS01 [Neocucurbitaria sp. VM-36]
MKVATIIFALCVAFDTLAPPLKDEVMARADCGWCTSMYDFCVHNGHSAGQTGCMQTCREHVCHRNPECKDCGGDVFSHCPEVSRYPN